MPLAENNHLSPYLSIVVTSRNDNHGGDMLSRMQIFLTTLLKQCREYKLAAELIIVEWNPPANALPLDQCLDFSEKNDYCPIKIITVPTEYHRSLSYSKELPLFQMIAKNVGIRRARGEFVLATNIDVIFSTELIKFLRRRCLKHGRIYRIDRTDVKRDIPAKSDLPEIQHYCKRNILRICTKDGVISSRYNVILLLKSFWLNNFRMISLPIDNKIKEILPWLPSKEHWLSLLRTGTYNQRTLSVALRHIQRAYRYFGNSALPIEAGDVYRRSGDTTVLDTTPPDPKTPCFRNNNKFQRLHTNACGDFTLLARKDWFDLNANPEWEMFSFHLDSVFLYLAEAKGLKESVLKPPARLFHIEHSAGFTPETGKAMYARIRKLGIPILTSTDLAEIRKTIHQTKTLYPANKDDWGLMKYKLTERLI